MNIVYNVAMILNKEKAFCLLACMLLLNGCQQETAAIESDDHDAPYINLTQYEFTTEEGKPLDFSNVTGYDDVDGLLSVELEGYVNYYRPGNYYPSLTCSDTHGNKSSVTITITVVEKPSVPTADASATEEPVKVSSCDAKNAQDKTKPCDEVLEDLSSYSRLYYDQSRETCMKDASDDETCNVIKTNDGRQWGYGLKKKE